MAQGEELAVPFEEELSIFDRVRQFGEGLVDTVAQTIHDHRQKAVAIIATGSAALGGGLAIEMLDTGSADASSRIAHTSTSCKKNDPSDVSVGYVNKAILPFASEVIKAYHEYHGSDVAVKRNQHEMFGMTNSHLTEVDINVPGELTNGDSGGYTFAAQFLGRVIPKDLVLATVSTYENKAIGVAHVQEGVYYFYIAKTKGTIEDPDQGLQWDMGRDYVKDLNPDTKVVSKLADGFEVPGDYTMSAASVITGTRQAGNVIADMIAHRDISEQKNLDVSEASYKIC